MKELKTEIADSHEALGYYFKKEWEKARQLFLNLRKKHPKTKLYRLYLYRVSEFSYTPPPLNWDGVFNYTTK